MDLFTVGAALKFAVQLETAGRDSYTAVAARTHASDRQALFADLAAGNAKRIQALRRLYDDHVYSDMDTGVLAPIASLDSQAYRAPDAPDPAADPLEAGQARETLAERFYADVVQRMDSGPRSLTRGIQKLAADNRARAELLAEWLDGGETG
jgi:rubrerythrin